MSARTASAVLRYRPAFVLSLAVVVSGCEWFTDFKRQPAIQPWQVVIDSTVPSRTNPVTSVPTTGMAVTGFQVSYRPLPAVLDSMAGLQNPVASDARSLENGHRFYQINCAVCHGDRGLGDGTAVAFGMPGINIVGDIAQARTDGYLFAVMRNGRGLMPSYNRIEELDRWDVVNYLRALQGPDAARVPAGAIAAPGVTGRAVTGATRTAPTRPAPYGMHTRPAAEPPAPDTAAANGETP